MGASRPRRQAQGRGLSDDSLGDGGSGTGPTDHEVTDPTTTRRLYGRRQGHALRQGQAALVEALLPQVVVPPTGQLDATTLFGDAAGAGRPLWLEIGFGGGEHLAALAAANPGVGVIGCEPFLNGVVSALNHIRDGELENVRLYMGDALDVLDRLATASLSGTFLLHPDPWPKLRHARRRFVNPGPLDLLADRIRPGGELRISTDHPIYLRWTLMQMAVRDDFKWVAAGPADWQVRPDDWPATRYEAKARRLEHEAWYLLYRRA